jgi:hypothetical protein
MEGKPNECSPGTMPSQGLSSVMFFKSLGIECLFEDFLLGTPLTPATIQVGHRTHQSMEGVLRCANGRSTTPMQEVEALLACSLEMMYLTPFLWLKLSLPSFQ